MPDCLIRSEADLLAVRSLLREQATIAGMGLVDQTRIITAGSELARNVLKYAHGSGEMRVVQCSDGRRRGVCAVFRDQGPGIVDLTLAMEDGYSTGGSMGKGLPGAKRLVDEFNIESAPGRGTVITLIKWSR